MMHFTTFILLFEDSDLPDIEFFCPLIWKDDSIKITGDYYYGNAENRWNELKLSLDNSKFSVDFFREVSNIGKSLEAESLSVIVEQFKSDYFADDELKRIQNPTVGRFSFLSNSEEHTKDFQTTVYRFLKQTNGFVVHVFDRVYSAEAFRDLFVIVAID